MKQDIIKEIKNIFPVEKPICFNYNSARDTVLELINGLQSERILNVVINMSHDDGSKEETWVNMYRVSNSIENPAEAFRAAVVEYCKSDEGADMVTYAGGSPNWGDINTESPSDFFRERGFFPLHDSVEMVVDHDDIVYNSNDTDTDSD